MRVAHVVGNLDYGGPQLLVLKLIERLSEFDHTVIVQSPRDGPLHAAYAGAADLKRLMRRGGTIGPFIRLTRLLREAAPDAIIAHQFGNHAFVAMAASLARVPATFGVATNDPVDYSRSRWKPMLLAHLARPFCAGEIAVSHAVAEVLVARLRLPAGRVTVIHNGCPVDDIAARAETGRIGRQRNPGGLPRMMMAAAISRTKDYATVIKAVEVLKRRGRPVEFWAVGKPSRQERLSALESLIEELDVGDLVTLLGARNDVYELMGACDVVVHASRSEGFGVVLIEAMAAGVPVVASDIPACREVLDGGRSGVLVPPKDAHALADAIQRILENDSERLSLVQSGRDRVRSRFEISHMAAGYAGLISSVHG